MSRGRPHMTDGREWQMGAENPETVLGRSGQQLAAGLLGHLGLDIGGCRRRGAIVPFRDVPA